jgi:hypothetical protein
MKVKGEKGNTAWRMIFRVVPINLPSISYFSLSPFILTLPLPFLFSCDCLSIVSLISEGWHYHLLPGEKRLLHYVLDGSLAHSEVIINPGNRSKQCCSTALSMQQTISGTKVAICTSASSGSGYFPLRQILNSFLTSFTLFFFKEDTRCKSHDKLQVLHT